MSPLHVLFTGEYEKYDTAHAAAGGLVIGEIYQVTTVHRSGHLVFYELAGFRNRYNGRMFEAVVPHTLPEINDALRNPARRVDIWDSNTLTWQAQPGGSYMAVHPGLGKVRIVDVDDTDEPPAYNLRITRTHGVSPHNILILPGDRTVRLMWVFHARGVRQTVDADYVDGQLRKVTHNIFMQLRESEGQKLVPHNIQFVYDAPEVEHMPMRARAVNLDMFSRIPGLQERYAEPMMKLPMFEGEYLMRVPQGTDHDLIALKPSIIAK